MDIYDQAEMGGSFKKLKLLGMSAPWQKSQIQEWGSTVGALNQKELSNDPGNSVKITSHINKYI